MFFDIFKNSNIYYFCRFSGLKNLSGPQLVFLYKLFTRVSRRIKIYTEVPREIFELVSTVRTSGCYKDSVNFTDGFMSFIVYLEFLQAPDYFYRCIEEKLGMKSLEDLMRFSDAIEKLQLEHPA